MMDSHSQGLDGKPQLRTWDGYRDANGTPVYLPANTKNVNPDAAKRDDFNPIEAAKKGHEYSGKVKKEYERQREWQKYAKKAAEEAEKAGKSVVGAVKRKGIPKGLVGDVVQYVFDPIDLQPDGLKFPPRPAFPPPVPNDPMPSPPGDQTNICGSILSSSMFPQVKGPGACIAQFTLYKAPFGYNPLGRIGYELANTTREELAPYRFGIVKVLCPDGYEAMFPRGEGFILERDGEEKKGIAGENKPPAFWRLEWSYKKYKIIGTQYVHLGYQVMWGWSNNVGAYNPSDAGDGAAYSDYIVSRLDCIVPIEWDFQPPVDPNQYDRENDEEEMGCKWQKDEISYVLPELKIGDKEIGGSTIQIDDGLKPLAEYLCKAIEMMHKGLGLNLLDDKEFPVNLTNESGAKIKPKSMSEIQHYYFEQVASLVGLPVKNTLTNLEDETKDLQFKNIQDCLSYIVHQQRESDLDLMVLEQYSTRIAQQLEAVTQIALRQHSDIEMIIQEMGFKYTTKTEQRPCLYKTGMKDDDEKTGIIELFKGGTVSYPVRIWSDDFDQRQIAMKTNLYAEIAARAFLQPTNTDGDVQGLDARVKMGKSKGEDWLEWVKTINTPENGVVSGSSTPFIEEYTKGTVAAKAIKAPTSGLSLFMKQPKAGKKQ